jgi:hypothetical protein
VHAAGRKLAGAVQDYLVSFARLPCHELRLLDASSDFQGWQLPIGGMAAHLVSFRVEVKSVALFRCIIMAG